MLYGSKTNPQIKESAKTFVAAISMFIVMFSLSQVLGEPITVVDKTGVDVLCKGKGAYTGPTTLSNYSTCMFNDGSMLECNNKTDKCTSKPPTKAQIRNPPKMVPQVQLTPLPGGQKK
jgi:hypothetical protein